MKKIIVVALAVVFVLPSIGLAMVQGWDSIPGMGIHRGFYPGDIRSEGPRLWAALDLTPEQGQKMKDLRESLFRESFPLRNEIRSKRFELRALWAQTNPDEGKILAKQKEINALRADLQEKVTKSRLEMRKILTPEQQAKLTFLRGRYRMWRANEGGCGFGLPHRRLDGGPGMGNGPRW